MEGNNVPEPTPLRTLTPFLTHVAEKKGSNMKKARQPQYVNPKKAPVKTPLNKQSKVKGGNLARFNDIPDNVSNFSKATKTRTKLGTQAKLRKAKIEKAERELTGKPNNIIFDKTEDDGYAESTFTKGNNGKPSKEVTDKPNNIRAPINYTQHQN